MKKINKLLFILLLLIPIRINALGVVDSKISSDETANTGDMITMSLHLNFNGISPKDNNSFGIGGILVDLDYDHDVIKFVSANANGFISDNIKNNDTEKLFSVISEDSNPNDCADKLLYCGEYDVSIKFYVKDTDKNSTQIKINDVTVLGWQLEDGTHKTYAESDATDFKNSIDKVHNITIKKTEIKTQEPKDKKITTDEEIKNTISNTVTAKMKNKESIIDSDGKSNDNYLKELNVKGYVLNFYKRTNSYDLEIEKDVNELEIEATTEDEKATYEIKGNKDIKGNNNIIEIIVTAESGKKNTYTINITYEDEEDKKENQTISIDNVKNTFNNHKLYFYIGGGIIALIIIIAIIMTTINSNKINQKLDDL